jgi:hypothetical protein
MRRISHQLHVPDLISSDFYLFFTVKEKLDQIQVADKDQSFEFLSEILSNIDQEELSGVSQPWVLRIRNYLFIS